MGNPVLLFGEILADIFPDRSVLGGAPFNVARHLKAFGQHPVLITRLGNDALRDVVLDEMSASGMATLGVQLGNRHPTGRVMVRFEDGTHQFDILPEQAYDYIDASVVRMIALSVRPVLAYFGTLAQRNDTSRRALKAMLRSTAAARFLDLNLRKPWFDESIIRQSLRDADAVKMNGDELGLLAGMLELTGDNAQAQAMQLIRRFDLQQAVVTRAEQGAWQIERDGRTTEADNRGPVPGLVDTVGAGDGFSAVHMLGTLLGWPVALTLERANDFAAAICGIRGAIPDHADFYQPYTRDWNI